jgi:hypothetical protein
MDDTAHVELELTVKRGPAPEDTVTTGPSDYEFIDNKFPADEPAEKEPDDEPGH